MNIQTFMVRLVEPDPIAELWEEASERLIESPPVRGSRRLCRKIALDWLAQHADSGLSRLQAVECVWEAWKMLLDDVFPEAKQTLVRERKLQRCLAQKQVEQRSEEWYRMRQVCVTGTIIEDILAGGAGRTNVLIEKLRNEAFKKDLSRIPKPLRHGNIFEHIATLYYTRKYGFTIQHLGLILSRHHSGLGASPDGIISPVGLSLAERTRHHGRLIEIKCPWSRVPDGSISRAYAHQMQLQMLSTEIDCCNFLEAVFRERSLSDWQAATGWLARGVFFLSADESFVYEEHTLLQMPGEPDLEPEACERPNMRACFWVLEAFLEHEVPADPEWLPRHKSHFDAFLAELRAHKEAGTFPEMPVKRQRFQPSAVSNVFFDLDDLPEPAEAAPAKRQKFEPKPVCEVFMDLE